MAQRAAPRAGERRTREGLAHERLRLSYGLVRRSARSASAGGLLAHSFRPRIVTGALHLLGGGAIDGQKLEPRVHAERQPSQVALMVAALDNDWLLSGHYHGQAMSQVSAMLLENNGCDMLLKRYSVLSCGNCAGARLHRHRRRAVIGRSSKDRPG